MTFFKLLYFYFYGFASEWHLKAMTLALYLTIALESKDFNTTQTWVGYLLPVGCRCAKQEEEDGH